MLDLDRSLQRLSVPAGSALSSLKTAFAPRASVAGSSVLDSCARNLQEVCEALGKEPDARSSACGESRRSRNKGDKGRQKFNK